MGAVSHESYNTTKQLKQYLQTYHVIIFLKTTLSIDANLEVNST